MAKGTSSIFMALTVVFGGLLLVLGVLRAVLITLLPVDVERGDGPLRQIFLTFLELTDPGSMTQDIDSSPAVKVLTILTGLTGVVLFSSLIAFITTAVDSRLAELRKGRSIVIEEDHTLILGWSDRVIEILYELILANESEDDPVVVILADREKEEMDDELAFRLPDTQNTKVVTRAGNPSSIASLATVGLAEAKAVIVLANCNSGAAPSDKAASDMSVVKTTLAVTTTGENTDAPVVVELFEESQRNLARSIDAERVICLDTDDILAKVIVQTSRSSGLSVVYDEMLSFDGAELYLFEETWPANENFGTIAFQFEDGVPIGLVSPDGEVTINPALETTLAPGTQLIVLASDDSALRLVDQRRTPPVPSPLPQRTITAAPERQLVIGSNPKVNTIVGEYADYVSEGSEIDLVDRWPVNAHASAGLVSSESPMSVAKLDLDPFVTAELEQLDLARYANVIILSEDHDERPEDWIDSETLIILLQLQRLLRQIDESARPKLIAEILGSDSRDLVTRTGVKEFVISNRMISMLVAQISENRELEHVYANLFAEDGSEIYLKDASLYFDELPVSVTFAEMMAAAQLREEIALGVKLIAQEANPDDNFGVKLVPLKTERFDIVAGDSIVVVAEDER